jgi:hypothetical protein
MKRRKRQYLLPLQQFIGRQTLFPSDPVAPVDIPKDIAVGHKKAYLGSTKLCRRQRNIQFPQGAS